MKGTLLSVLAAAAAVAVGLSAQATGLRNDDDAFALLERVKAEIGARCDDADFVKGILRSCREGNDRVLEAYVASADGKIILASDFAMPDGYDPRRYAWFNTDDRYKSEAYVDFVSGDEVVTYSLKVRGEAMTYVIGIDVRMPDE